MNDEDYPTHAGYSDAVDPDTGYFRKDSEGEYHRMRLHDFIISMNNAMRGGNAITIHKTASVGYSTCFPYSKFDVSNVPKGEKNG